MVVVAERLLLEQREETAAAEELQVVVGRVIQTYRALVLESPEE